MCNVAVQARWWDEDALLMLPQMEERGVKLLASRKLPSLRALLEECRRQPAQARTALEQALGSARAAADCMQVDHLLTARKPSCPSQTPCVKSTGISAAGMTPLHLEWLPNGHTV